MRFLIMLQPDARQDALREELERAGVLLEAAGGRLLIQARSRDEALEWARRCPAPCEIEEVRE